jgi:hypothetical protein
MCYVQKAKNVPKILMLPLSLFPLFSASLTDLANGAECYKMTLRHIARLDRKEHSTQDANSCGRLENSETRSQSYDFRIHSYNASVGMG